jgi:hypothetical protein
LCLSFVVLGNRIIVVVVVVVAIVVVVVVFAACVVVSLSIIYLSTSDLARV